MVTPIGQDALKLMKRMHAATLGDKKRALRLRIDALLNTMTAKAQNATLAEALRLGIWP